LSLPFYDKTKILLFLSFCVWYCGFLRVGIKLKGIVWSFILIVKFSIGSRSFC